MRSVSVLLQLVALLSFCRECVPSPDLQRLFESLLRDYSPLERPVQNESETLTVEFGIHLLQIMDLDEKTQVLTTNIWIHTTWDDKHLAWNPEQFGGVRDLRLPHDKIWRPDIVLYNSADEHFETNFQPNVLVHSSGSCTYIAPATVRSSCSMDVRWFPFDEQRCRLKFGSWTHHGLDLDLKMMEADLSQYQTNGEWHLAGVTGARTDRTYECCEETYPDVTYSLVLRRRGGYHTLTLLLPCALLSILALLSLLLPAESGHKTTLGGAVLISLVVLMLLMAEVVPPTSATVPLIYQYFITTMFIVGLSLVTTVLVLHCHHHQPSSMPQWIRVFLLQWCASFLRMTPPRDDKDLNGDLPLKSAESGATSATRRSGEEEPPVPGSRGLSVGSAAEQDLGQILIEVRSVADRLRERDRGEVLRDEWRFAGRVIDRLCLVVYAALAALCTAAIFMSAPAFRD